MPPLACCDDGTAAVVLVLVLVMLLLLLLTGGGCPPRRVLRKCLGIEICGTDVAAASPSVGTCDGGNDDGGSALILLPSGVCSSRRFSFHLQN